VVADLGFKVGDTAYAIIKASEVIVGKQCRDRGGTASKAVQFPTKRHYRRCRMCRLDAA